ncbi:MAG TPA: VWA domain-containing protein, partial [Pseudolabrys sp.]|nr:VWA domain-containing protein [Pseudolabrys sp.]
MLTNHARAAALAFFMLPFVLLNRGWANESVPPVARIKPVVEVAFVLDTTGSMGALIEGAKRKIWSIATAIVDANPDAEVRMGLVAYRDIGDDYVTKTFPLTKDIQDIYANLLELKARG